MIYVISLREIKRENKSVFMNLINTILDSLSNNLESNNRRISGCARQLIKISDLNERVDQRPTLGVLVAHAGFEQALDDLLHLTGDELDRQRLVLREVVVGVASNSRRSRQLAR